MPGSETVARCHSREQAEQSITWWAAGAADEWGDTLILSLSILVLRYASFHYPSYPSDGQAQVEPPFAGHTGRPEHIEA